LSFNYKKLRGKIRERFKTQENFAKELGISSVTLSAKLNNRVEFTRLEIDKSCEILGIPKTAIPEFFFYPES
jgi:transcriptional regulator with XRE-family HTH domain